MNAESQVDTNPAINSQRFQIIQVLTGAVVSVFALFVGGPVLSLLVISSLLIAQVTASRFGTALGVCIGMIYSLLFILFEFIILVPFLRYVPFSRSLFFDEAWIEPFVARATTLEHLVELNRPGAIFISVVPVAVAIFLFFRTKSLHRPVSANPAVIMLSFWPLVAGGIRKFQDPFSYVASTASGDGRNFFLHVQRIRVTSDFTNLQNITSQGDFGASLSSLLSDGFGSTGLLRFDDQYSVAALYLFFAVLITASAIAAVVALAGAKIENPVWAGAEWAYAAFIVVTFASIQMPWVMNEMFRSGFFSAVVAMSLTAAMVAICVSQLPLPHKLGLLLAIAILTFAVYQVAAIYPLSAALILSLPTIWRKLRSNPLPISSVLVAVSLATMFVLPRSIEQLRSRLLLEGAITYLEDSFWIPLAVAGLAISLARGKLRIFGLIIFIVGANTAGFQILARELREADGQFGYGYYGVKCGYLGLFILLFTLIAGAGALFLLAMREREKVLNISASNRGFRVLSALGLVLLGSTTSRFIFPESRGFYGKSDGWIQPTSAGLEIALKYWTYPRVVFTQISDPGNDQLTNFWHPYFWSGDPWNWAYSGHGDDPGTICAFIKNKDVVVVTANAGHADLLRNTCGAKVEIL
jgi:hypothetical protein